MGIQTLQLLAGAKQARGLTVKYEMKRINI